jgi:hypothetical protein
MTGPANTTDFRLRLPPVLAVLSVLAACAAPRAGIDIEGKLDVLGPTPDLVAAGLPGDWVSQGRAGPGQARVVERDGVPALRLTPGGDGFIVARRLDAALVMSPYMSWSWNVEPHGAGLHPVRLIVGFHGGHPDSAGRAREPLSLLGSALPSHDRSFAIAWADSPLRRGSVLRPEGAGPRAPLYIARGGRENANAWWLETVDLERIYRELWPGDASSRVRVVFVGLAVTPAAGDTPAAFVSGIRLSR